MVWSRAVAHIRVCSGAITFHSFIPFVPDDVNQKKKRSFQNTLHLCVLYWFLYRFRRSVGYLLVVNHAISNYVVARVQMNGGHVFSRTRKRQDDKCAVLKVFFAYYNDDSGRRRITFFYKKKYSNKK